MADKNDERGRGSAGREPDHRRAPREARQAAREGQRLPQRLRAQGPGRGPAARARREVEGSARGREAPGGGRGPHDAEARDGQGLVRHAAGHERADPGLHQQRPHRRRNPRGVQALGPGRHRGRGRRGLQDQQGRAFRARDEAAPAVEIAAPAAGEIPWAHGHGSALSHALRGPHRDARGAPSLRDPLAGSCRRSASSSWRAATSRSRRR